MKTLAGRFRALADETRLEILSQLLRRGELCVCDIEQGLGISQSKASRHLRYLLHAGLVEDRRGGPWVFYRTVPSPSEEAQAVIEAVARILNGRPPTEAGRRLERWLATKKRANAACGPNARQGGRRRPRAGTRIG